MGDFCICAFLFLNGLVLLGIHGELVAVRLAIIGLHKKDED